MKGKSLIIEKNAVADHCPIISPFKKGETGERVGESQLQILATHI